MMKKTAGIFNIVCLVCFFFFLTVLPGDSHARIGFSVDDFRKSRICRQEGFYDHGSYLLTDDPVYKGRFASNFMSADRRYRVQLISDKKNGRVLFQYLYYDHTGDTVLSLKDGSVSLSFVAEASSGSIDAEEFISLVAQANRGDRNVKFTRDIGGYSVSVTRYEGEMINGWSIGISK